MFVWLDVSPWLERTNQFADAVHTIGSRGFWENSKRLDCMHREDGVVTNLSKDPATFGESLADVFGRIFDRVSFRKRLAKFSLRPIAIEQLNDSRRGPVLKLVVDAHQMSGEQCRTTVPILEVVHLRSSRLCVYPK